MKKSINNCVRAQAPGEQHRPLYGCGKFPENYRIPAPAGYCIIEHPCLSMVIDQYAACEYVIIMDMTRTPSPLAGPAMKAAGALVAGIVFSTCHMTNPAWWAVTAVSAAALLAVTGNRGRFASFTAFIMIFAAGAFACSVRRTVNRPLFFPGEAVGQKVYVTGTVDSAVRIARGNTSFILRSNSVSIGDSTYYTQRLMPCTLYGRELSIFAGTRIELAGDVKRSRLPLAGRNGAHRFGRRRFTHKLTVTRYHPTPVIVTNDINPLDRLRRAISSSVDSRRFFGRSALLKTMTIADRRELPPDMSDRFAQSGIAHILAVSGLHVGIVALAVHALLLLLPLGKPARSSVTLCAIVCYAAICGFRPPVTRAAIMIAMVFGASLFERPKNTENSLFAALIVLCAFDPSSLFGPSLQLSFAAVWGLSTFYPAAEASFPALSRAARPVRYLFGLVIISAIATLLTAPIAVAHFGYIPLYGIPANIIAVPLAFLIILPGLTAMALMALGPVAAPVVMVLAYATGACLWLLDALSRFVSGLPHAVQETGAVSPLVGLCTLSWLFVLSRARGRPSFVKAAVYIPLVLMLIVTWYPLAVSGPFGEHDGDVCFFDVGQGDAALVSCGRDRHFLVDAGPRYGGYNAGAYLIAPSLKNMGVGRLDAIIVSHLHDDHIGGLASVIAQIPTGSIICRESAADSLSALLGRTVTGVCAGDSITFGEGGILILAPPPGDVLIDPEESAAENNRSIVARFDIAGKRILFTGDIETRVQKLTTSWEDRMNAEILKVPHHGAAGLNVGFLTLVRPGVAVVSCGAGNRYGHPADSTMELLNGHADEVFRTDRDGAVIVSLPSLKVATY